MATNETQLEPPECSFKGNPDLYGLGLRLAFYITCATGSIASIFLDKQFKYLIDSSVAFCLATLFVLVRETVAGTLYASEASLFFWLVIIQVLAVLNFKRAIIASPLGYMINLLLMVGFLVYASWFWNTGIDRLPRVGDGCTEYGFYFFKFDVRSFWWRLVNRIVFTILTVFLGFFAVLIAGFIGFIFVIFLFKAIRPKKTRPPRRDRPSQAEDQTPLDPMDDAHTAEFRDMVKGTALEKLLLSNKADKWSPLARGIGTGFLIVLTSFWMAFFIHAVELQIQWNNIRGVQRLDSVGQLIPFLLSVGMLGHVLYSIIWRKDIAAGAEQTTSSVAEVSESCPYKTAANTVGQHELLPVAAQVPASPSA
ncbi:hypothetical protein B0H63DRAFT_190581 [Podospora didyma]|uniref:Uncharacterized protein n=1 Tax=Podospora didyma TaxID=330526 RepID=A0AAE0NR85_9PEZI|nr:hypothetical protein B0H63DRAFT_190581 [Podospora didyma]